MYPAATNGSSESCSVDSIRVLSIRVARACALYGVRVSTIGASFAPLAMTITVYSLTPSRIGIISSRFT